MEQSVGKNLDMFDQNLFYPSGDWYEAVWSMNREKMLKTHFISHLWTKWGFFLQLSFEQWQTPLILSKVFGITKNKRGLPDKENVSSVAHSTAALLLT